MTHCDRCVLRRFASPSRGSWRCRAADTDVATQDEIEAMEDGAVAVPADPAGKPITGGQPAPGPHRGEPAGSQNNGTSVLKLQ